MEGGGVGGGLPVYSAGDFRGVGAGSGAAAQEPPARRRRAGRVPAGRGAAGGPPSRRAGVALSTALRRPGHSRLCGRGADAGARGPTRGRPGSRRGGGCRRRRHPGSATARRPHACAREALGFGTGLPGQTPWSARLGRRRRHWWPRPPMAPASRPLSVGRVKRRAGGATRPGSRSGRRPDNMPRNGPTGRQ